MWISKKKLEAMLDGVEMRTYNHCTSFVLQRVHELRKELMVAAGELDKSREQVFQRISKNNPAQPLYNDGEFWPTITISEVLKAVLTHLKLTVVKSPEKIEVVKKGGPEKP